MATIFLLINMKAVISNFSVYKTHIFNKTLPALFLFAIFFSCSTSKRYENTIISDRNLRKSDRTEIVKIAKKLLGSKYRYGGNTPRKGFDCSGFTSYVYGKYGYYLPRTSKSQSKIGKKIKIQNAKPGDLIFFRNKTKINHVGIVVSNKNNSLIIIHSTTSKGVKKDDVLNSTYWKKRITFAKDIITH